jgi:hypothetical protein
VSMVSFSMFTVGPSMSAGVGAQIASARPSSTPASETAPGSDALDQLRALAGPAGDELVEAVRHELRREYERGCVDGRGGPRLLPQVVAGETEFQRFKRRMHRRARHAAREWMARTRPLRKAVFHLILVVVLSAAAVAVSLRVSSSGADKKFAIPTLGR